MKIIMGLTILLGVLLILSTNEKSFKKIIGDDIENIAKLSSTIIYAEIENSITKPIFVGQTMANDLFLKGWLADENPDGSDAGQIEVMTRYLSNYSKKYGYDSVTLISAKSNIYYHQEGINKVVSLGDSHDVWYYDFIGSEKTYDLDVDIDEANDGKLTVFTNCRIEDDNGALLGVIGIGIKMSSLQTMLAQYEEEYELKAFLINEDGLVQIDSIAENIEITNFFNNEETAKLKDKIITDKTNMQVFWYPEGGTEHCLITKYVDSMEWYIIIEKNTEQMQQMLATQMYQALILITLIIVLVLLILSYVVRLYNRMLLKTACLDDVTGLPNKKMFEEIFTRNAKRPACREGTLFLFDVDSFKNVNDSFGHLFGNTMLYKISEIAKEVIGASGFVARWGGDEFVGAIYTSRAEAEKLLNELAKKASEIKEAGSGAISLSIGATAINNGGSIDSLIKQADTAMYRSKSNGRNQTTFF